MEPTRINLGAGMQQAPGWIGYDRSRSVLIARSRPLTRLAGLLHRAGLVSRPSALPWPESTRVHDLTRGIPHPDASVDVVYSSHMLEHLARADADALLAECHRVLRPGGWIRLVVPDLRVLARAYVDGDRDYFRSDEPTIADAFMHALELGAPDRRRPALERLVRRLLRTDDAGHRWMYDADSLAQRLERAGFAEVAETAYREGRCAEAAALDSQARSSVYLEARKPAAPSSAARQAPTATSSE